MKLVLGLVNYAAVYRWTSLCCTSIRICLSEIAVLPEP